MILGSPETGKIMQHGLIIRSHTTQSQNSNTFLLINNQMH